MGPFPVQIETSECDKDTCLYALVMWRDSIRSCVAPASTATSPAPISKTRFAAAVTAKCHAAVPKRHGCPPPSEVAKLPGRSNQLDMLERVALPPRSAGFILIHLHHNWPWLITWGMWWGSAKYCTTRRAGGTDFLVVLERQTEKTSWIPWNTGWLIGISISDSDNPYSERIFSSSPKIDPKNGPLVNFPRSAVISALPNHRAPPNKKPWCSLTLWMMDNFGGVHSINPVGIRSSKFVDVPDTSTWNIHFKWLFGETTISQVKDLNNATETTLCNGCFRFQVGLLLFSNWSQDETSPRQDKKSPWTNQQLQNWGHLIWHQLNQCIMGESLKITIEFCIVWPNLGKLL